jgi:predicted dehydrogenase
MESDNQNRRTFLKTSAATSLGLAAGLNAYGLPESTVLGANDKIRMGFIGVGNRGSQLMNIFMDNKDVEVVALCDVYEPYTTRKRDQVHPRYLKELEGRVPKMGEQFAKAPTLYKDYRKLLENKDIDAVCIATPDHWHALQTIDAIQAGKDVYVEKPLTITILEGRKMVEAQAQSKQLVAVGLNRR